MSSGRGSRHHIGEVTLGAALPPGDELGELVLQPVEATTVGEGSRLVMVTIVILQTN